MKNKINLFFSVLLGILSLLIPLSVVTMVFLNHHKASKTLVRLKTHQSFEVIDNGNDILERVVCISGKDTSIKLEEIPRHLFPGEVIGMIYNYIHNDPNLVVLTDTSTGKEYTFKVNFWDHYEIFEKTVHISGKDTIIRFDKVDNFSNKSNKL